MNSCIQVDYRFSFLVRYGIKYLNPLNYIELCELLSSVNYALRLSLLKALKYFNPLFHEKIITFNELYSLVEIVHPDDRIKTIDLFSPALEQIVNTPDKLFNLSEIIPQNDRLKVLSLFTSDFLEIFINTFDQLSKLLLLLPKSDYTHIPPERRSSLTLFFIEAKNGQYDLLLALRSSLKRIINTPDRICEILGILTNQTEKKHFLDRLIGFGTLKEILNKSPLPASSLGKIANVVSENTFQFLLEKLELDYTKAITQNPIDMSLLFYTINPEKKNSFLVCFFTLLTNNSLLDHHTEIINIIQQQNDKKTRDPLIDAYLEVYEHSRDKEPDIHSFFGKFKFNKNQKTNAVKDLRAYRRNPPDAKIDLSKHQGPLNNGRLGDIYKLAQKP